MTVNKSCENKKGSKSEEVKEKKLKLNEQLTLAINGYNEAYTTLSDIGTKLLNERMRSVDLISHIEVLINSITNHPKSFDSDFKEIEIKKINFKQGCEYAEEELKKAKESAIGAAVGITGGAAVVSLAPTTAMWIATTFGTASTGTAISTLSGAAATNAALAWLGGGALASGGGGISAGTALLALAGPVGWGIAGISLFASIVLFTNSRIKSTNQKKNEIQSILGNTNLLKKNIVDMESLLIETNELRTKLSLKFNMEMVKYGSDFKKLGVAEQYELGALVNNTKSLAYLLSREISTDGTK